MELSNEEKKIIKALTKKEKKVIGAMDEILSFEDISEKTGIPCDELASVLDELLEKDLVSEVKRYVGKYKKF